MFFPGKGALLYLVGAELSLIFFEKNVAMFSILVLAVGDSVPMIINRVYKGSQHPFSDRRYIESAIVGVIICTVTGILFVRWYEALIASIAAIFIEGIDMKTGLEKVDDNLVIPVVSGLVIFLLRLFGLN
jgi:dolichol kinase